MCIRDSIKTIEAYIANLKRNDREAETEFDEKSDQLDGMSYEALVAELKKWEPIPKPQNAVQELVAVHRDRYITYLRQKIEEKRPRTQNVQQPRANAAENPLRVTSTTEPIPPELMHNLLEGYTDKIVTADADFLKNSATKYNAKVLYKQNAKKAGFIDIVTPCSVWDDLGNLKEEMLTIIKGGVADPQMEVIWPKMKKIMDEQIDEYQQVAQNVPIDLEMQKEFFTKAWDYIMSGVNEAQLKTKMLTLCNLEMEQPPDSEDEQNVLANFPQTAEGNRLFYQRACVVTILHHLFAFKETSVTFITSKTTNPSTAKSIIGLLGKTLTDTCRYLDNLQYLPASEHARIVAQLSVANQ